jgi:hypothetical protein
VSDVFGLPDTLSGPIRRFSSLHYEPGGLVGEGGNTLLQNAQLYADLMDIIVGNVVENPATTAITTDKFNGEAAAMLAENPAIKLLPYNKSAQIDEGATYFPNLYYAHNCPWPTGSKLTVFSPSIYIGQPSAPNQPAYTDPRGWTAHSFKEQRARDAWARVARYNTLHGAGVLSGVMFDSMGPSSYKTQCDPLTGNQYTLPAWLSQVRSIGDEAIARRPNAAYPVMGNGLITGSAYFSSTNPTSALMGHVDIGWAESWLRSNYDLPTAFHSEANWQKDVDMVYDVSVTKGKYFCGTINLCNATAGSGSCSFDDSQREQWRRYSIATMLIGRTHRSWFEFFQDTSIYPWRETHAYYDADLGDPIDTFTPDAGSTAVAIKYKRPNGSYRRRYTLGVAFVNPTAGSIDVTLDRDYTDPIDSSTHLSGATITLAAHTGRVFVHVPLVVNADSPVVTITTPAAPGTATSIQTLTLAGTASDADGIALVEVSLNGAAYVPAVGATSWSLDLMLALGVNTISVRATDANTAPNQTVAPTTITYETGPLIVIESPSSQVTTRNVTLTAKVDSLVGIAAVDYRVGTGSYATLPSIGGDLYSIALTLPGKKGQTITTPIHVRATDTDGSQTFTALEVAVSIPFH